MAQQQMTLPYGPIRNSNLLSNHWLEHRLVLEPEWQDLRHRAQGILDRLGELWKREQANVEQYAEASLEQAFIQPVLAELGWHLVYQTNLRGRRPDYALFLDKAAHDAAVQAGRKEQAFWDHPTLVADAKAWTVNLDRPTRIDNQKREYPPEQIESYINASRRGYGILTNGRLWRLYPRELSAHQPRFETYLECDLGRLLAEWTRRTRPGGSGRSRNRHV